MGESGRLEGARSPCDDRAVPYPVFLTFVLRVALVLQLEMGLNCDCSRLRDANGLEISRPFAGELVDTVVDQALIQL